MPLLLFLLLIAGPAFAQDCSFTYTFTGNATQAGQSNLSGNTPCVNWRITLSTTGSLSSTVTFQTSPDNSSFSSVGNSVCSSSQQPPCIIQGANPIVGTQGMMYVAAYGSYVRLVVTASSGSGTGTIRAYGAKGASPSAGNFGGGGGGSGTVTHTGTLTATAIVTGNGGADIITPNANATLDGSGNISTPGTGTFGSAGGAGSITLSGASSGTNTIAPAAIAGTGSTVTLPAGASVTVLPDAGAANNFLTGITTGGAITKAQPTDANLSLSNITTNDVTTARHGFAPILPNDATKFLDGTGNYSVPAGSGGGSGSGASLFSTTASVTATAASPTSLIGAVTGSTTIPANTLQAGQVLEFFAQGFYSTPAAPRALNVELLIGGSTRVSTGSETVPANITLGTWQLICILTTRTTGVSGTQIANCTILLTQEVAGGNATAHDLEAAAAWTINTTAGQAVDLRVTWDATTGAPSITSTNIALWIPGSTAPGGANTQLQYNNSGAFGGVGSYTIPNISTSAAPVASLPTSGWNIRNSAVLDDFSTGATWVHVIDTGVANLRTVTRALTVPYTLYAQIECRAALPRINSQVCGVYLTDGTKFQGIELLLQQATDVQLIGETYTAQTGGSVATVFGPTINIVGHTVSVRIINNGTNRTFSYFGNGAWHQVLSQASGTFLTETEAGFGGNSVISASNSVDVKLTYWSVQ